MKIEFNDKAQQDITIGSLILTLTNKPCDKILLVIEEGSNNSSVLLVDLENSNVTGKYFSINDLNSDIKSKNKIQISSGWLDVRKVIDSSEVTLVINSKKIDE